LAKQAPERFDSFVIGAAHPYAENLQPLRDTMLGNLETFAAGMERSLGDLWTPAMRARLLSNDLEATRALMQDRVSVADVLPTMTVPCLLFVGELDPRLPQVRECTARLPSAALFTLPGCDHVATLGRSEAIIPHVKRFLSTVPR
jgi:pimeloyl-ACP methyl ester carboxylesterase